MGFTGRDVADAVVDVGYRLRDRLDEWKQRPARPEPELKRPRQRTRMKPVTMVKVSCLSFLGTMAVTLLVAGGTGVGPASVRFWTEDAPPVVSENAAGGGTLTLPTTAPRTTAPKADLPAAPLPSSSTSTAGEHTSSQAPSTSTTTRTSKPASSSTSSSPEPTKPAASSSAPSSPATQEPAPTGTSAGPTTPAETPTTDPGPVEILPVP